MKALRRVTLALLVVVWVPASALAFSFGTFAPGEKILSIQVGSGGPSISFDTSTNVLLFSAPISTITTTLGVYNIPLGDVVFDSQVMLSSESVTAPIPFAFFGGQITATFLNGAAADLTITDVAGGFATLLAADYLSPESLSFLANAPGGYGFPITGSLDGDFLVDAGMSDAAFAAAFGSAGSYFANLSGFISDGVPVGNNLCLLIEPSCANSPTGHLDDFTVNPAATITPVAVPEPAVVSLLLLGAAVLGARSRRAR